MSMEVRATLCKSDSSARVLNMTMKEQLAAGASLTAVTVLATFWFLRDKIIAGVKLPGKTKERLRLWSLKARGLEEYVGRHRCYAT